MKMKWIFLLSLLVLAQQVNAEESVVIDSQAVGAAPGAANADGNAPAPSDSSAEANDANKDQLLEGGRMSPRERAAVARAAMADTNQQAGDNFLATNKARQGVISLASGVQYTVLRAGNGKRPTENSLIRCRYTGTLIDGSSFDKSDDKKPASMHVAGLLPGLKEAVKLMPVGSKWEIVIPPQLAYGAFGNRGVGPNAVLIYDMEILGIR